MNTKGPPINGKTFLTETQAAQILGKLKVIRNVDGQTIKIQTIQTNPQTGAKKIVAIPIQSMPNSGQNLSVSPMKTLRTSEGTILPQGRTIKISSPRTSGYTGQVSIVKPVTSMPSFHTVTSAQLQSLQNMHGIHSVAGVQSLQPSGSNIHTVTLTPQKQMLTAQRFPRQNLQFESVGVKRPAETDPLDISESKRRKTEKGKRESYIFIF